MQRRLFTAALACFFAASCSSSSDAPAPPGGPVTGGPGGGGPSLTTDSLDSLVLDADGIVDLTPDVIGEFRTVFDRYAAVELPQGRLHVLIQPGVPVAKVRRAREILRQHLTDLPGGSSKADVAQAMVDRSAVLGIFTDTAAVDMTNPDVEAVISGMSTSLVPLPASHIVIEGSAEYMQVAPDIDLTFGATAVLVQQAGLAVARPGFAGQIDDLAAAAVAAGQFTAPADLPAQAVPSAFLAMVMDVHSDVYAHDPNGDGTAAIAGASYDFHTREDLLSGDPALGTWINAFFSGDHTFEAELPADFTGNFDCLRRGANPYTARSQHLRSVRLTGTNAAEIFAAPFDVTLIGNDGNNNLKGRAGDDTLIGGLGFDTAVFSFPMANYEVRFEGDTVIVEDVFGGHEGTDTLQGMQRLQFSDQGINL